MKYMIKLESLQILFKEQSLFQSVFSIKAKIRIIVNHNYTYQTEDQTLNGKYVRWNSQTISIHPQQAYRPIEIQFQFFKKDVLVGRARTFVTFGKNRSDCLDIIDEQYMVIGKFMFKLQCLSPKQSPSKTLYPATQRPYQQTIKRPQYTPRQNTNRQFYRYPQSKEQAKNYSKESTMKKQRRKFGSLICCESARARRRAVRPIRVLNIPIQYGDEQLEYGELRNPESWPIQYYSPPFKPIS